MSDTLPPSGAGRFATAYPQVWQCYSALGAAAAGAGALGARERRLVKLALALGAGSEGAVHSHARQALGEGIPPEDLRQICILAITTLGFPAAMAGLSWVNDITQPDPGKED
ncbi:MAG: carboxymuconolactone decarboxylase family protein [Roseovarius sp.]